MIAIEVSFLTGRYSAAAHYDREQPEWPPHAARLFSAMVAAWADLEPPDEPERTALEWLETQPPPRITAPEAVCRRVVSHFVPVNDAGVVSAAQYRRRACQLDSLLQQHDEEIEAAAAMTKTAERLEGRITKARDVTAMTTGAGNTNSGSALALLPEGRTKKERYFPSVTLLEPDTGPSPADGGYLSADASSAPVSKRPPVVVYAWDHSPPGGLAGPLDELLARVTRLGHSSSLVSCRLRGDAPDPTHVPGEGAQMLRWVRPGQLAALVDEHRRHQAVRPRNLPFRGVRYREPTPDRFEPAVTALPATAGDWIVFELQPHHRRMPMTRTVELTRALRESVLSHVRDPLPEGVSGHSHDGTATTAPHIGFLALPNVGHEHADGRIMGLALWMPYGLDDQARNAALRGIAAWERDRGDRSLQLRMGQRGAVEMNRRQPPLALVSLRQAVWARPSTGWASATPIALPAHPGNLRAASPAARAKAWARAEEAVARSCEHVGLPAPVDVQVSLVSHFVGSRPAGDFPVFEQGATGSTRTVRRLVHASVEFAEPTRGPLVLGSGRFLGLGLMRPVADAADQGANNGDGAGHG